MLFVFNEEMFIKKKEIFENTFVSTGAYIKLY